MDQKEAWNTLYGKQGRQWRGSSDMTFPFPPGSRVLDVGCGNGKTSEALLRSGYKVTGLDFSETAVDFCRTHVPDMDAVCGPVTSMPFRDGGFDGVSVIHVMEHLDDGEIAMMTDEIERILRPGGIVMVRSFNTDDMRSKDASDGGVFETRGNGIRYRYFSEIALETIFSRFVPVYIRTETHPTKFGEIRSRTEGVFEKR